MSPAATGVAIGGGGTIILLLIALLFGADPQALMEQMGGMQQQMPGQTQADSGQPLDPHQEELKGFVSVVLADTEEVWSRIFSEVGKDYEEPTLVLFSGQVESACGYASSAVGPFYCPADNNVYLDLSFLDELRTRFGAPGDFAGAYVIAHEVGHHVQNQLGISEQVSSMQGRISQEEYNQLSVRLELQADFFAGVWAHNAQKMFGSLEQGDIEEAMNAANQIGDDRLQMEAQGYVVPDAFTHGTSEQRARWFMKGYKTGDMSQGDTFKAREL